MNYKYKRALERTDATANIPEDVWQKAAEADKAMEEGHQSYATVEKLVAEAAHGGEPGYEAQILVGGGLHLHHLPELRAAGIDAVHIGGAARPSGWSGPVDAAAVREWREALDA